METLKALLEEYIVGTKKGDTFIIPEYEAPINLVMSTDLTYEYLVEGYYIIQNDSNLAKFLKQ